MSAAVSLPAILGLIRAYRMVFAVADNRQLGLRNAHGREKFVRGTRSSIAEGQVILGRSPFIGATLNYQLLALIVQKNPPDHADVILQYRHRIGPYGGLIVIE